MPQSSYAFAVARIRALEKGLISKERMGRLAEGSLDDVVRMLNEHGYGDMPEATAAQCDALIARELAKAVLEVREISPEPDVTDLFLLKADIHNIKVLIKARLLEGKEEPYLVEGGIYDKDALAAAVRDHDYRDLPEAIKEELNALEKALQSKVNPQMVSVALDRAYLKQTNAVLQKHKSAFAEQYFRARADFDNVLALMRIRAMGGHKDMLGDVLLPAGDIAHSTFLDAFEQPFESIMKMLATGKAGTAIAKGLEEVQRTGHNSALEKARDDYLMQLIKKNKYDSMTLAPVLGYYLAREQEAKCVRLIVTAKRNGLSEQTIAERLREVYG